VVQACNIFEFFQVYFEADIGGGTASLDANFFFFKQTMHHKMANQITPFVYAMPFITKGNTKQIEILSLGKGSSV